MQSALYSNAKEQIIISEDGRGPQVPHPEWLRTAWGGKGLVGGDH